MMGLLEVLVELLQAPKPGTIRIPSQIPFARGVGSSENSADTRQYLVCFCYEILVVCIRHKIDVARPNGLRLSRRADVARTPATKTRKDNQSLC